MWQEILTFLSNIDYLRYSLYMLAGIMAGVVNTLAGGGSIFTLSALLFDLSAGMANGTNRLGILLQNLLGVLTFKRSGLLDVKASMPYLIASLIGAILGAFAATDIDGQILEWVIGGVMVFMLAMTIFKPKTQISPNLVLSKKRKVLNFVIFVIVGFYGGFVQAGIGILLIVALSRTQFSFIRANAVKMLIIFAYTIPVFAIFVYHGQVEWFLAAWLALGQMIGTWLAAKFAVGNPKINEVVRWVLIAMMIITIIKMFHIWEHLVELINYVQPLVNGLSRYI